MKKSYFLLFAILSFFILTAEDCDNDKSSDGIQKIQQEKLLSEGTRQLGMPAIVNWQEKKTLKWIFELRDNTEILNYVYAYSEYTGKFTFIGKCIGFPIPYATQYTNPQKIIRDNGSSFGTLAQADPNGLFSPASANATWILLVNPKTGEPKPMYMEPNVTVVPFPLPDEVCTINYHEPKNNK